LKISTRKGCFLSFEWEKNNFTSFGPTLKKFWKNPLVPNPHDNSDAEVVSLLLIALTLLNFFSEPSRELA